jgi:predicted nuclease of predicted toxin-antitoxin system
MRFKLDENLGASLQRLFTAKGHQVETVRQQGLGGASDSDIYAACCSEGYCLVTFDLDFADVTRFRGHRCGGIVVIRPPKNASRSLVEILCMQFLEALSAASVEKQLWIVEAGRIRQHQFEDVGSA